MDNLHIIVPVTPEIERLVAALLGQEGVTVTMEQSEPSSDFMTLKQGAELAGINYFTFRRWVVSEGKMPYSRPSGVKHGQIRVKRQDIEKLLAGELARKKTGKPHREVSAI